MKRNTLYVAGLLLCSLMFHQNCSMVAGNSHDELSTLGKTCATIIQKTYRDTYYGHLREQCASCHADGGRGRIYFASFNFETAAEKFMNTGRQKIEALMLTSGHQGNAANGPGQQPIIDQYRAVWQKAEADAANCGGIVAIETSSKNTPTGALINADNNDPNTERWRTLEWDLFTEMKSPDQLSKIHLIVNFQYRPLILAGVLEGFEFRRPQGRIRAGAPADTAYTLDKMFIYRNGVLLANATAYENMLITVSTATNAPLINGANAPAPVSKINGVADMNFATDKFSLRFAEIRDPAGNAIGVVGGGGTGGGGQQVPARVTYAELMNAGNSLGIFARSCVGCHNANNAAGALNIANYANAVVVASSIKARTRNALRPMPTGGLLSQFEQDVIARWVDIGAPQN